MICLVFEPFPRLPKELRLEIWKHALPAPRIIKLCLKNLKGSTDPAGPASAKDDHRDWFAQSSPLPTNIQLVNSEARAVFLQTYKIVGMVDESKATRKPTMEIDLDRDIMYFDIWSPDRRTRSLSGFSVDRKDSSHWRERIKIVALDLAIILHPYRVHEGFRELYFQPEKRAVPVMEHILDVFPSMEQLYLIIDGMDEKTDAPRRMVDPLDSDKYACWHERMGRHRAMNWIPGTVAALQKKRNTTGPHLKIALKLFVNRSSPCGTTNRSVTDTEAPSEENNEAATELTMCWRYRQAHCLFQNPVVLRHEHTGINCRFSCCSRRPL